MHPLLDFCPFGVNIQVIVIPLFDSCRYNINVVDLTNGFVAFVARVESSFLDGMFSGVFSSWSDGFDRSDEQAV